MKGMAQEREEKNVREHFEQSFIRDPPERWMKKVKEKAQEEEKA